MLIPVQVLPGVDYNKAHNVVEGIPDVCMIWSLPDGSLQLDCSLVVCWVLLHMLWSMHEYDLQPEGSLQGVHCRVDRL